MVTLPPGTEITFRRGSILYTGTVVGEAEPWHGGTIYRVSIDCHVYPGEPSVIDVLSCRIEEVMPC